MLPWRSAAALSLAELGRHDEARTLAADEVRRAQSFGAPRAIGIALRAHALVGPPAERPKRLAEALAVLEPSPARLEHARVLVDLGATFRAAGQRTAAREPLLEGLALAARCGARTLERRARAELAAIGVRPRRTERAGADSLTPSERRVVELAATGGTNREIAQTLFVTEKTVETHLGRSFRKLDISSRRQLPDVLARAAKSPSSVDLRPGLLTTGECDAPDLAEKVTGLRFAHDNRAVRRLRSQSLHPSRAWQRSCAAAGWRRGSVGREPTRAPKPSRTSMGCGSSRARRTAMTMRSTPQSHGRCVRGHRSWVPAAAFSTRASSWRGSSRASPPPVTPSATQVHPIQSSSRSRAASSGRSANPTASPGPAWQAPWERAVHRLPLVRLRLGRQLRRPAGRGWRRRLGARAGRGSPGDQALRPPVLHGDALPAAGRYRADRPLDPLILAFLDAARDHAELTARQASTS